jgi:hypothetical protein
LQAGRSNRIAGGRPPTGPAHKSAAPRPAGEVPRQRGGGFSLALRGCWSAPTRGGPGVNQVLAKAIMRTAWCAPAGRRRCAGAALCWGPWLPQQKATGRGPNDRLREDMVAADSRPAFLGQVSGPRGRRQVRWCPKKQAHTLWRSGALGWPRCELATRVLARHAGRAGPQACVRCPARSLAPVGRHGGRRSKRGLSAAGPLAARGTA